MNRPDGRLAAPPLHLLALESRTYSELAAALWMSPLAHRAPVGDGHPVLVLPGLAAGDASTWVLRCFLRRQGYRMHGWELGRNLGRADIAMQLQSRVAALAERYGRSVSVVGWSLGGIYARGLAHATPRAIRSVITLASPFRGNPRANHVWPIYEALSGRSAYDRPGPAWTEEPPPRPTTAIVSRSDGVVAWQCCLEREGPQSENIEVDGSHCGLGHNPSVLYAIADRLAQAEGAWRPFDMTAGIRAWFYRRPSIAAPLSPPLEAA